ncbi:hypothetical protein M422DRAFT_175469, partial [Sphaerobolus stellatus SS14]
ISHLHAISSNTYAQIPPEINHSKLSPRSIKYTLIGYYGRDAYKLYGCASSRTIVKA